MLEKRRRHFDKKMTWVQGFVTGIEMAVFMIELAGINLFGYEDR